MCRSFPVIYQDTAFKQFRYDRYVVGLFLQSTQTMDPITHRWDYLRFFRAVFCISDYRTSCHKLQSGTVLHWKHLSSKHRIIFFVELRVIQLYSLFIKCIILFLFNIYRFQTKTRLQGHMNLFHVHIDISFSSCNQLARNGICNYTSIITIFSEMY